MNLNSELAKDRLSFVLQNMFYATKAVSVFLMNFKGDVLAEMGNVDTEEFCKIIPQNMIDVQNIMQSYNSSSKDKITSVVSGTNGSFLLSLVAENIILVAFYAKNVDVFAAASDLARYSDELSATFKRILTTGNL